MSSMENAVPRKRMDNALVKKKFLAHFNYMPEPKLSSGTMDIIPDADDDRNKIRRKVNKRKKLLM